MIYMCMQLMMLELTTYTAHNVTHPPVLLKTYTQKYHFIGLGSMFDFFQVLSYSEG